MVGCEKNSNNSPTINNPSTEEPSTTTKEDELDVNKTLELKINKALVEVNWLDNYSVTALTNLAKID